MKIENLKAVRQWAQEKIDSGQEPPWSWFQYMKLIEALNSIIKGKESTLNTATLYPQLQIVDDDFKGDSNKILEIDMPM